MRIAAKTSLLAASLIALTVVGVPALVLGAPNSHANAEAAQTTADQSTDPTSQAADRKAEAQARLTAVKLKVCQHREKAITNIMSRISDRGQKHLNLFTTIAERTEKFYLDKGKTLATYDTLVANVNAQKASAQAAVDAVAADSTTFTCDGTNPKGAVTAFKASLKSEITALKDYKTAVKDLIVGVKSVQGTTTSADSGTTGGDQ